MILCLSKQSKDPQTGENVRVSYTKIQNNQTPRMKLSNEKIQRLNDADFEWSLRALQVQFYCDVQDHFNLIE